MIVQMRHALTDRIPIGERSLARFSNRPITIRLAGDIDAEDEDAVEDAVMIGILREAGSDIAAHRLVRSFFAFDREADARSAAAALEARGHETRVTGADLPAIDLHVPGVPMIGTTRVMDAVAGEGPNRSLRAPTGGWVLVAEKALVTDHEGLRRHRALVLATAERHRGQCLGCEVSVHAALRPSGAK